MWVAGIRYMDTVHTMQSQLASSLGIDPTRVHVVAMDDSQPLPVDEMPSLEQQRKELQQRQPVVVVGSPGLNVSFAVVEGLAPRIHPVPGHSVRGRDTHSRLRGS